MVYKILVVEDKEIYRIAYKRGLEKAGFIVKFAKNEQEAEEMRKVINFNAFVIDIMLHEAGGKRKGGIILARNIREDEINNKKQRVPIVFVTILGDDADIKHEIEQWKLTDQEILTKFFPVATLAKILNDALVTKDKSEG